METMRGKIERLPVERDDEKPSCINILQLPEQMILEIFCRIPINTLIQCKYVCKSWRRFLSDPNFTKSLFSRTPACLFLQDYSETRTRKTKHYHLKPNKHILANLESVSSPNNMVLKLSDPNALYNRLHSNYEGIIGSCNGFLCLFRFNSKTVSFIFNISNPVTGECVPLPDNTEIGGPLPHFGFGYSSISGVYKVVVLASNAHRYHFTDRRHHPRKLEVMVLTVGSGIWRRIGKVPDTMGTRNGIFHDGFLHWVCRCKRRDSSLLTKNEEKRGDCLFIRAFDVESERFKDLPMPHNPFYSNSLLQLGVLGGSLSLSNGRVYWVMKEYGVKKSWTKVLTFGRATINSTRHIEVLKLIEEGKVLLLSDSELCLFTPETKTIVRVEIDGIPSNDLISTFVAEHTPSFVSPKDIINDYISKVRT